MDDHPYDEILCLLWQQESILEKRGQNYNTYIAYVKDGVWEHRFQILVTPNIDIQQTNTAFLFFLSDRVSIYYMGYQMRYIPFIWNVEKKEIAHLKGQRF